MPLFRRKSKGASPPVAHAVILHLPLSDDEFGTGDERDAVNVLEDRIIEAVEPGAETTTATNSAPARPSSTYGRDANELFDAISGCLRDFPLRPGSYAIKRFGSADDPNSAEERLELA